MTAARSFGPARPAVPPPPADGLAYWLGLPLRWAYQAAHNGLGIVRVLDITRVRPLPEGLIPAGHPWATGLNPATGKPIWPANVIFRSPRTPGTIDLPIDDYVIDVVGKFLAARVAMSAAGADVPLGPRRRMPHAINYIHGTSHYNSGILVFSDFADALSFLADPRFRRELRRFVAEQKREVLMLFRKRDYCEREYAYFVCAVRTLFPWFCNANGPKRKVLWGNASPYPAANLITGHWADDVYALKQPGGAARVIRPPIPAGEYFAGTYGGGRRHTRWPERLLARLTQWRVRVRGAKGGMYFVDRRTAYADQIQRDAKLGRPDEPVARI